MKNSLHNVFYVLVINLNKNIKWGVYLYEKNKMLYYELFITILVILAIMLIVLDFNNIIDLNVKPYKTWGYIILITFWIDYVYFYINSKNKKRIF